MSNTIKYSTQTENNTLKKGNFVIGVNDVDYGPTSETGYHNTITPPEGGYVVYKNRGDNQRSIYVAESDEELVLLKDDFGATGTTANDILVWAAQQSDVIILNNPLDNIVTDGLVLCLDANFTCSYPKASTTWYDLSGNGNDGSLVNGPTFDSGNGGSIVFDGTNDSITSTAPLSSGEDTYTIESFWKTDELKTQVIWEQNTSTLQIGTRVCMILLNRGVGGFNGQNADFHSSVPYSINTWYHWVITVDNTLSTNKVKVYVNGNLYAQGNPSNTLNTGADSAAIGHKIPSSSEEFNGDISIVRVYNKTLSSDEVLQNFNAQKARFGL